MKRFWIHHPAISEPVGPIRWLKWRFAEWLIHLGYVGRHLEHRALYGKDDDLPF